VTPEIERLVSSAATADQIAKTARNGGMRSLFESGINHVLKGETSIEEALRVTEPPREDAPAPGAAPIQPPHPRHTPPATAAILEAHPPVPPVPGTKGPTKSDPLAAFELVDDLDLPPARFEITRRGAVILLVDDEDQLRRAMRDLLERQGYTILEARDGAEALAEIDRGNPDLMILDLNLPGVDGYTVLAQVRSREITRNLPVIVLTAKGDEDNEVKVLELGADDFLTKPFRARALAARLQSTLSRHRVL
jgi:CheY-like chemotaxis protein